MKGKKKIKKPWCIYRHGTPTGIGMVLEESKTSALVLYCEGQHYSPEVWDKKYLWRFATITAAIKKFKGWGGCGIEELKEMISSHFPSEAKEIAKIK